MDSPNLYSTNNRKTEYMNSNTTSEKIKVGLINNMNNNFFSVARYLRDNDIDAHLYEIQNSHQHFQPQTDTFKNVNHMKWIHTFPSDLTKKSWIFLNKKTLRKTFEQYDFIISCGESVAFLEKSGVRSDLIIPYGSDLYEVPFANVRYSFTSDLIKSIIEWDIARFQQIAYKKARGVCILTNSDIYGGPLRKMNIIPSFNVIPPMLYNQESSYVDLNKYLDNYIVAKLESSGFIVFNHSRQYWASNLQNLDDFDTYLSGKRNDKVIHAFSKFRETTNMNNPLLVLFEYGQDVPASKNLVKTLGIVDDVLWIPIQPRKIILKLLKKYATLATDQFRKNIANGFSGTAFEILASGVPLITHNTNPDETYLQSPVMEAYSETDILKIFYDYENNPQKYKDIGKKSKEWFDEHLGLGLAKKYVRLIELMVENKSLTQNDKLLRDIFEK